jgi:hypothetical protein
MADVPWQGLLELSPVIDDSPSEQTLLLVGDHSSLTLLFFFFLLMLNLHVLHLPSPGHPHRVPYYQTGPVIPGR